LRNHSEWDCRKALVNKYYKLVYYLAQPYCLGYPNLSKDIRGQGFLGLVIGVNTIIKKDLWDQDRAGKIIYKCIRGGLIKAILDSYLIHIPRSQILKVKLKKGEKFKYSDVYPEIIGLHEHFWPYDYGNQEFNYSDWYKYFKLNELEIQICESLLEGKTRREIALELGYHSSWIQVKIKEIRRKIKNVKKRKG